jgi:hypothetical protein
MPDGKMTWSEHYGRQLGTLRSPAEGVVTKVTDKGVTVTDAQGKKHFVETVTDFPFNGLTGLTYTPTVKVGDKVGVDDMLAASNFVDRKTGGLSMGVNLRMAWLPYKGYSVSGDTNVLWRRPDGSFTFGPIADVQVGQGMGSIAVDPKTGEQLDTDVVVYQDGIKHTYKAGEEILVQPGDSITLTPYLAHIFGPKPGTGDLICGEVSKVNDDLTDNYFMEYAQHLFPARAAEIKHRGFLDDYDLGLRATEVYEDE